MEGHRRMLQQGVQPPSLERRRQLHRQRVGVGDQQEQQEYLNDVEDGDDVGDDLPVAALVAVGHCRGEPGQHQLPQ